MEMAYLTWLLDLVMMTTVVCYLEFIFSLFLSLNRGSVWIIFSQCSVCNEEYYGSYCDPCSCENGNCDDGILGDGTCSCSSGCFGENCEIECICEYGECDEMGSCVIQDTQEIHVLFVCTKSDVFHQKKENYVCVQKKYVNPVEALGEN